MSQSIQHASRRTLMTGGLGVAAAVAALPLAATAQAPAAQPV